MSTSQGSSDGDAADRLAAFVEQLHEALSLGENVDLLAMARHHGVGAVEAE